MLRRRLVTDVEMLWNIDLPTSKAKVKMFQVIPNLSLVVEPTVWTERFWVYKDLRVMHDRPYWIPVPLETAFKVQYAASESLPVITINYRTRGDHIVFLLSHECQTKFEQ